MLNKLRPLQATLFFLFHRRCLRAGMYIKNWNVYKKKQHFYAGKEAALLKKNSLEANGVYPTLPEKFIKLSLFLWLR